MKIQFIEQAIIIKITGTEATHLLDGGHLSLAMPLIDTHVHKFHLKCFDNIDMPITPITLCKPSHFQVSYDALKEECLGRPSKQGITADLNGVSMSVQVDLKSFKTKRAAH